MIGIFLQILKHLLLTLIQTCFNKRMGVLANFFSSSSMQPLTYFQFMSFFQGNCLNKPLVRMSISNDTKEGSDTLRSKNHSKSKGCHFIRGMKRKIGQSKRLFTLWQGIL